MKSFETPYVDVKKFDVTDILTTSIPTTSGNEEEEEPPPLGGNVGQFCAS